MRFKYKKKTYPAVKIGDVYYVRDEDFLKSECYKEYKKLKKELKHKNKLWKSAFHAYKNLKKQMKKEILELREAFDTMKVLAIPKVYTDGDYLSTTVLKICNEALKDTEKYVKEGEK